MKRLLTALDELLQAYEKVTPQIDQQMVDRVLAAREDAMRRHEILKRGFISSTKAWLAHAAILLVFCSLNAAAWDTSLNPDKVPSIGWGLYGGRLAGIVDDNARYTEFGADVRVPVTNYLSLTMDFSQTTVSNAPLGVSTEANRIGASVRVYLHDLK